MTHVLIQVIVLRHGEEGGVGGEEEEHQNLSGGVNKAPQNGPRSIFLGAAGGRSELDLSQRPVEPAGPPSSYFLREVGVK